MTYTGLRAAIQEYMACYEEVFVHNIDVFIRQAENRIPHMTRLPPTRKLVTGTLTANNNLLVPPTDYLSPDSLIVIDDGEEYPVQNKDPEFIDMCFPVTAKRGRPRFYAKIDDRTLKLGPTPGLAYATQLQYFAYPMSICDAPTGHTYMGDSCESLLLSQSLLEAYTFLKGDEELWQRYKGRATETAVLFKGFGDGKTRKDSFEEPDRRVVEVAD